MSASADALELAELAEVQMAVACTRSGSDETSASDGLIEMADDTVDEPASSASAPSTSEASSSSPTPEDDDGRERSASGAGSEFHI